MSFVAVALALVMGWFATIHRGSIANDWLVELMDGAALNPRAADPSSAPKQPDSLKSAPPDTTPYVRPAVPEDYAPGGEEAIPKDVTTPSPQQDNHEPCSNIKNKGSNYSK